MSSKDHHIAERVGISLITNCVVTLLLGTHALRCHVRHKVNRRKDSDEIITEQESVQIGITTIVRRGGN